MTLWQNIGFRIVQRKFQYASEKESLEKMHRENPCSRWGFKISDDPGQSVVHSDGCSEVNGNCGVWKAICFSAGGCTEFDSKFTLRQRRCVLVQEILAFQQSRLKSLGLRVERSWKESQVSLGIPMWHH